MNGLGPGKYVPSSPICTEPFNSKYTVQEDIGRGKFAVVRKCVNIESGEEVAAKIIRKRRKGKSCREEILREVVMLELAMAHPRLVSLREVFETQSELILVTEYCSGGELFDECVIKESFKEDDVRHLLAQILEGLAYLHDNNIVHLDLKPQNILLTKPFPEGDVKICDLGFACLTNTGEDIRDIIGTPDYVAPEVLDYEPLNIQTDMWSLGVLTYVMLTTCSPFAGDTQQETFCNITQVKIDYPEELFGHINPLAKDFISKLLVKRPRDRMTAKQCLDHPWLQDMRKSMKISVPTPDHSEELAHEMVVPSNWHLSPDRRSSFSNLSNPLAIKELLEQDSHSSTQPDASSSVIEGRSSTSEEKDSICKPLSHIDIDRQSNDRSSSASFETCAESIEEGSGFAATDSDTSPADGVGLCDNSSTTTPTSTTKSDTISAFVTDIVQEVSSNYKSNPQSDTKLDTKAIGQQNGGLFLMERHHASATDENSMKSSIQGTPQAQTQSSNSLASAAPVDSNKEENSKKRMSMEIPPKKAKCIQEEVEEASGTKSDGVLASMQHSQGEHSAPSTGPCPEQPAQACNGIEDFRNAV